MMSAASNSLKLLRRISETSSKDKSIHPSSKTKLHTYDDWDGLSTNDTEETVTVTNSSATTPDLKEFETLDILMKDIKFRKLLKGHTDMVMAVDSYLSSKSERIIVSAGKDKIVGIWSAKKCALISKLTGHEDEIHCICAMPSLNGKDIVISGSKDTTARIWSSERTSDPHFKEMKILRGHKDAVGAVVAFKGADSVCMIATGSHDKTIIIWDILGEKKKTLNGHKGKIYALAVDTSSSDIRLVSGGGDNLILLWDVLNESILLSLQGHTDWVRCLAIHSPSDNKEVVLFLLSSISFNIIITLGLHYSQREH